METKAVPGRAKPAPEERNRLSTAVLAVSLTLLALALVVIALAVASFMDEGGSGGDVLPVSGQGQQGGDGRG